MSRPGFLLKLVGGVVYATAVLGGLPFLAAWTLRWPRAWIFLAVVLALSSATMFGIFPSRPDLLDERYRPPIQEGQPLADRILTVVLLLSFVGLLVFIPRDVFRLQLLGVTGPAAAGCGLVLFVAGWTLMTLAIRENAFAAPVVKHQGERGQIVVETGPYRVVRHPMYAGALPVMVGMALWLGSWAGALLAVVPVATLVVRIGVEERLLRRALPGYAEYARRVPYRLVPRVW